MCEGYVLKPSALHWLIQFLCYRSIQVPQRQKRRMTQMAAMRSGGRLAVSTMPWVPSCDSYASIYSASSRLVRLAALAVGLPHSAGQNNTTTKTCHFLFWFMSLHSVLMVTSPPPLFSLSVSLSLFPLHLPQVSSVSSWPLALCMPLWGRARRPTLPLLSDLAEHATALHRFGAAPRGQRGQVSSVWLFSSLTPADCYAAAQVKWQWIVSKSWKFG